jgi:hypothetical protein
MILKLLAEKDEFLMVRQAVEICARFERGEITPLLTWALSQL